MKKIDIITVYHNPKFIDWTYKIGTSEDIKKAIEASKLVAEVRTNDLDKAFELTNNIDKPWIENKEVYAWNAGPKGHRSTSVGDFMFRRSDSTWWRVAAVGFSKIELPEG